MFSSSAGYQDVLTAGPHILFSDGGSSGTDYCWLAIGQGGMALAQDNLQSAWPAVAFGSNAVVQNSQCLVSGAGNDLITGKYHLLINTSPSGTNSCWFLLESTGLYLAPDDPVQPWYFVSYGSTQTASNSQCGVSGVGTNISGAGNNLTLSLSLTFTPAYTGAKNVYTDVNASNPDYIAAATYTVQ